MPQTKQRRRTGTVTSATTTPVNTQNDFFRTLMNPPELQEWDTPSSRGTFSCPPNRGICQVNNPDDYFRDGLYYSASPNDLCGPGSFEGSDASTPAITTRSSGLLCPGWRSRGFPCFSGILSTTRTRISAQVPQCCWFQTCEPVRPLSIHP